MGDGRDLRALFGSNDREIRATEQFTNRQEQWAAVTAALADHLRAVCAPGFDVEDLEAPRDNVLVFHGVGGIGKSTLSRKVEAALARSEQRPAQWGAPVWGNGAARILPVRIDLARSAGTDFERVVLTIRLALAELGRPLPAFDLALRRYWDQVHPGESLEEYLRRGGLGRRFGRAVPQQMQSALADIAQALLLPGTVGAVVGQVTGALVRALRDHRASVRALAGCARLADFLEAEPDLDSLAYATHLLAWELTRQPRGRAVVPVILLDTFEDVGDRVHRDLERLLQRVVWLMPNAFFVITGRSRLQWADEALHGQLDWAGPAAWPGLAADQPATDATGPALPDGRTPSSSGQTSHGARQILVGDFSAEDCDDYLARRLTRDGAPVIGPDVRAVITARSHGLPLHLDLAVQRFLAIRRTGRDPRPADLDFDFPALIVRTLSDLTPDERHVLRSVSLLDNFDVALASRAAGMTYESAALRMVERPFVRVDPQAVWPYHLHGVICSTIRTAGDQADDRWSERDWTQAAERAFEAVGERWAQAPAPGRELLVICLRQGLRLARDFGLDLGWLADAAWSYVGDSVWEPLAPPAPDEAAPPTLRTAADALVEMLSTLARRQHEHRERTVARLTAVVDSALLPAELCDMAFYYRAKAQRDLGRSRDSGDGMRRVAEGGGRLAPAARRGLAHLARLTGDFPTALRTAGTLGWDGRHHRVLGDVWWVQGDMARAAEAYRAARDEAEQHAVAGERATAQAQRAFTLAFADPAVASDELDLAHQLLVGLDLRATRLTAHIAALVRDAGAASAQIEGRARVLHTEAANAGITAARLTVELALGFHHAVLADHARLDVCLARLREAVRGGDYAYYDDIVCFMSGRPVPDDGTSRARWLDGPGPTRARWQGLVIARRALYGGAS
ncbi:MULTISPECIES: ATP/GTP-binding protein [unclassified Streptomyces]|uniref:ATP/GTP-binding protein n=1 Tax=unclassified Streptomyces TaxID=2593676 RepID=UPI0024765166|nr:MULTISPECIES: ATP/GTP-binding protein [unclassified Streptomyces]